MHKFGKSKLVTVSRHPEEFIKMASMDVLTPDIFKVRLQRKIAANANIRLEPDRFLYVRNRAISGEESWGPNQNYDAFPSTEIRAGCSTFAGSTVDIDHDPSLPVGQVLDSFYVPKGVISAKERSGSLTAAIRPFAGYDKLESGDQIVGDWIENVWAIDKQAIESFYPRSVEAIKDGEITDTSMGCEISHSECSICGNKASEPSQYCQCIGAFGVNKGALWPHPVTGAMAPSYERCYKLSFFEDSLILCESFNNVAGSQGADINAKLLQIIAHKHVNMSNINQKQMAGSLRLIYNSLSDINKEQFMHILESVK